MKYDYLIVGAGLSGCVFAERISSVLNKNVLIVEKRDHIGGNCYDYYNEDGLLIHKYGPHWFHTNDQDVFDYLSKFTSWHIHEHLVMSCVDGKLYPFPINRDTINSIYNLSLSSEEEAQSFLESIKVEINQPARNAEEVVTSKIGWSLYNLFFKNYTTKQWGLHPTELDKSITARIPIRTNTDCRYFTDKFQGIPADGYSAMFRKMIDSDRISVVLNTDYRLVLNSVEFDKIIYTGPIDEFFDFKFGRLPYRSLRFEHEIHNVPFFQKCQQVNYPNDFDFTRIIEWKHATGQVHQKTVITKEYPCASDELNEKLYPIATEESLRAYELYQSEVTKLNGIVFCGRLAEYKYYNMDQVIGRALAIFNKQLVKQYE
jgi:UDP-galactopyranose mutase